MLVEREHTQLSSKEICSSTENRTLKKKSENLKNQLFQIQVAQIMKQIVCWEKPMPFSWKAKCYTYTRVLNICLSDMLNLHSILHSQCHSVTIFTRRLTLTSVSGVTFNKLNGNENRCHSPYLILQLWQNVFSSKREY